MKVPHFFVQCQHKWKISCNVTYGTFAKVLTFFFKFFFAVLYWVNSYIISLNKVILLLFVVRGFPNWCQTEHLNRNLFNVVTISKMWNAFSCFTLHGLHLNRKQQFLYIICIQLKCLLSLSTVYENLERYIITTFLTLECRIKWYKS